MGCCEMLFWLLVGAMALCAVESVVRGWVWRAVIRSGAKDDVEGVVKKLRE